MEYEGFIVEKEPKRKVARIILNRPEKLNAVPIRDTRAINEVYKQLEEDEDVKVIILKGNGRAFTSGAEVGDLGVMLGMGTTGKEEKASQRGRLFVDGNVLFGRRGIFQTVQSCKKATICQVHKYCYGWGLNIANSCDIVIAAEGTLFTHPGFKYIGPATDLWSLVTKVGFAKAKELTLTGVPIDADEALRIGLINKVVPMDQLEAEVEKTADQIAQMPMDGIVMGKMNWEGVMEAMGMGSGWMTNTIMHTLQTNIHYDPGEFNLFKERRDKGVGGAIRMREQHYGETK